jgi:predicted nucleotide-binding protein
MVDVPAERSRRAIADQREQLAEIVNQARDGNFDAAFERLKRWKERTVRILADEVSQGEAQRLQAKRKGSFVMGNPMRNLVDEAQMYDAFLETLSEEIAAHPGEVLDVPVAATAAPPEVVSPAPGSSNAVFVVHGHDELNLLRLKEMLRDRWGLDPIVLSGEPGKGRTIIEKFEQEAQRAVFALALLTPDDIVEVKDQHYAQGRPNVIFELGWFYGRLGRSRVCILFKKGTQIHSDLDGISRLEFSERVDEKRDELERELAAAEIVK